jgi:hypothetical protein
VTVCIVCEGVYEITLFTMCDVARQGLGRHVPAAMNTHAVKEEMLGAVFSLRYVSYEIVST